MLGYVRRTLSVISAGLKEKVPYVLQRHVNLTKQLLKEIKCKIFILGLCITITTIFHWGYKELIDLQISFCYVFLSTGSLNICFTKFKDWC